MHPSRQAFEQISLDWFGMHLDWSKSWKFIRIWDSPKSHHGVREKKPEAKKCSKNSKIHFNNNLHGHAFNREGHTS